MLTREKTARFSSTVTCIPNRLASTAARKPTGPAPEMTTRAGSSGGRSVQLSASARIKLFSRCGTSSHSTVACKTASKAARPITLSGTRHAARNPLYAASASVTSYAQRKAAHESLICSAKTACSARDMRPRIVASPQRGAGGAAGSAEAAAASARALSFFTARS